MTDVPASADRLIAVTLDPKSLGRSRPDVEQERAAAIFDLLEANRFLLTQGPPGPYRLQLAMADDRMMFEVGDAEGAALSAVPVPIGSFRRLVHDYALVCDSYYEAIRTAPPSRIEAIDMGRRALHDEGSLLLAERLKGRIDVDPATARRLFTLICALHWKA
jgi:uncharacterized protein (UPF0262 family)